VLTLPLVVPYHAIRQWWGDRRWANKRACTATIITTPVTAAAAAAATAATATAATATAATATAATATAATDVVAIVAVAVGIAPAVIVGCEITVVNEVGVNGRVWEVCCGCVGGGVDMRSDSVIGSGAWCGGGSGGICVMAVIAVCGRWK
jgi:hypothetical protein